MRRTRTLLALLAAGSLVVAACGDDDTTEAGTTAETTATTGTAGDEGAAADDETAGDDMAGDEMTGDEMTGDEMTGDEMTGDESGEGQTIVDVAAGNPDFSILVAAVTEAGLAETLSGDGPFTVFAPTDEAFEEALDALGLTQDELLENPALGDILTYHVIGSEVMSTDLEPEQSVATVQGEEVTIVVDDDGARINDAEIVDTDIEADNGVIHVIDSVLLPPTVAADLGVG
jgi:pentapeptide MXKDX repeat protein